MKMLPEHREKINAAIKLCEDRFQDFCAELREIYGKEEAGKLQQFILQNTVFAGGVFRSIFTDTPVNDIGIFFTSLDASLEFQHRFLISRSKSIFKPSDISKHNTYTYARKDKKPPLSFVTYMPNEPKELLAGFDFSFNQHYFDLQRFKMEFAYDTFSQTGYCRAESRQTRDPLHQFIRALRFLQQGMQIQPESLIQLAAKIEGKNKDIYALMQDVNSSNGKELFKSIECTEKCYTEHDYFNQPDVVQTQDIPPDMYYMAHDGLRTLHGATVGAVLTNNTTQGIHRDYGIQPGTWLIEPAPMPQDIWANATVTPGQARYFTQPIQPMQPIPDEDFEVEDF